MRPDFVRKEMLTTEVSLRMPYDVAFILFWHKAQALSIWSMFARRPNVPRFAATSLRAERERQCSSLKHLHWARFPARRRLATKMNESFVATKQGERPRALSRSAFGLIVSLATLATCDRVLSSIATGQLISSEGGRSRRSGSLSRRKTHPRCEILTYPFHCNFRVAVTHLPYAKNRGRCEFLATRAIEVP